MPSLHNLPVWRHLVLRTAVYYAVAAAVASLIGDGTTSDAGVRGSEAFTDLVRGAPPSVGLVGTPPTALLAAVAMLTAFATSLPITWIYTLTRRKKGFQQSVVQTYLILPVVAAGIVVLVQSSLALAFSLAGIVAAVRFRTTLDDSKDAAGIFVVIGVGMAAAVAPSVSWVISFGFNLLMLVLYWTDFGRPVALEGKAAQKKLDDVLAEHNKTGMFLSRIDEAVLKDMSQEQLKALADRAQRRIKRNKTELADGSSVTEEFATFDQMLRIRAPDVDEARALCEPHFDGLFKPWRYLGRVRENDLFVLEYEVTLAETVTPGVVTDELGSIPDSPLRGVELR